MNGPTKNSVSLLIEYQCNLMQNTAHGALAVILSF